MNTNEKHDSNGTGLIKRTQTVKLEQMLVENHNDNKKDHNNNNNNSHNQNTSARSYASSYASSSTSNISDISTDVSSKFDESAEPPIKGDACPDGCECAACLFAVEYDRKEAALLATQKKIERLMTKCDEESRLKAAYELSKNGRGPLANDLTEQTLRNVTGGMQQHTDVANNGRVDTMNTSSSNSCGIKRRRRRTRCPSSSANRMRCPSTPTITPCSLPDETICRLPNGKVCRVSGGQLVEVTELEVATTLMADSPCGQRRKSCRKRCKTIVCMPPSTACFPAAAKRCGRPGRKASCPRLPKVLDYSEFNNMAVKATKKCSRKRNRNVTSPCIPAANKCGVFGVGRQKSKAASMYKCAPVVKCSPVVKCPPHYSQRSPCIKKCPPVKRLARKAICPSKRSVSRCAKKCSKARAPRRKTCAKNKSNKSSYKIELQSIPSDMIHSLQDTVRNNSQISSTSLDSYKYSNNNKCKRKQKKRSCSRKYKRNVSRKSCPKKRKRTLSCNHKRKKTLSCKRKRSKSTSCSIKRKTTKPPCSRKRKPSKSSSKANKKRKAPSKKKNALQSSPSLTSKTAMIKMKKTLKCAEDILRGIDDPPKDTPTEVSDEERPRRSKHDIRRSPPKYSRPTSTCRMSSGTRMSRSQSYSKPKETEAPPSEVGDDIEVNEEDCNQDGLPCGLNYIIDGAETVIRKEKAKKECLQDLRNRQVEKKQSLLERIYNKIGGNVEPSF